MQLLGSPPVFRVTHAPDNPWALLKKTTPSAFGNRQKKSVSFSPCVKKHDGMNPPFKIVDNLLAKCFNYTHSKDPRKRELAISCTEYGVRKGMRGINPDMRLRILVMQEFASLIERVEALADGVAITVFPQGGGHQLKIDKRFLKYLKKLMESFSDVYKID